MTPGTVAMSTRNEGRDAADSVADPAAIVGVVRETVVATDQAREYRIDFSPVDRQTRSHRRFTRLRLRRAYAIQGRTRASRYNVASNVSPTKRDTVRDERAVDRGGRGEKGEEEEQEANEGRKEKKTAAEAARMTATWAGGGAREATER